MSATRILCIGAFILAVLSYVIPSFPVLGIAVILVAVAGIIHG